MNKPQTYFNSTMVRLEATSGNVKKLYVSDFNSTMVRLEDKARIFSSKSAVISIPLWYD